MCAGCYPFKDRDPFIMKETPHIYFIGNQDKFATELVEGRCRSLTDRLFICAVDTNIALFDRCSTIGSQGQRTRVVMLPSFAATGTIALVNLRTLDCHSVSFATND